MLYYIQSFLRSFSRQSVTRLPKESLKKYAISLYDNVSFPGLHCHQTPPRKACSCIKLTKPTSVNRCMAFLCTVLMPLSPAVCHAAGNTDCAGRTVAGQVTAVSGTIPYNGHTITPADRTAEKADASSRTLRLSEKNFFSARKKGQARKRACPSFTDNFPTGGHAAVFSSLMLLPDLFQ